MPSPGPAVVESWRFDGGRVSVDRRARCLAVDGQTAKLSGRAFDLLVALIERADRVVSKQELLDIVWPGLVVEENNLQVHVMTLRKLMGAKSIVTVSGRGYQFTLTAQVPPAPAVAPPPAPALIGREALVAQLAQRLGPGGARLVTLSGPGGSGKTRLAQHVAALLGPQWPDGAWVVMLAPVRDPAHLTAGIAAALGLQEGGAVPMAELLIRFLRPRAVLLVLDNCEHLPTAAATVSALLEACPRLQVLATSRALLHLAGEQELKVPPLAPPDALQLLMQRAEALGRAVVEPEDRHAAAEICRRLDGLPLALELAAARLRSLTPGALLARLEHRLPLLTGGAGDAPDRQRTLRAATAWSHDLLGPPAQRLFRRLGLFAGGWSLEGAEAVDGGAEDTLDALEQLLDQNLVLRVDDLEGQPRYAMLETIREFALERLAEADERAACEQRHAVFFLQTARAAEPHLTSAGRWPWLALLRAEINNLRQALAWWVRQRAEALPSLQFAAALTWLWYFEGLYKEGRSWMAEALALPDAEAHPAARAAVLSGVARLAGFSAEMAEARSAAEASVALWRTQDDRRGLGFALFHLGVPALFIDGRERARAVLAEGTACFRAAGDPWGVAACTVYEGVALAILPGSEDAAVPLLGEGRARAAALGDDWLAVVGTAYLSVIAERRGDHEAARQGCSLMIAHARASQDRFRIARSLQQLAVVCIAQGRDDETLELLVEVLAMTQEQGRIGDLAPTLRMLIGPLAARRPQRELVVIAAAASRPDLPRPSMPPPDPRPLQRGLEHCRLALGDADYEAAWQEGSLMDIEPATALALRLLQAPAAPRLR